MPFNKSVVYLCLIIAFSIQGCAQNNSKKKTLDAAKSESFMIYLVRHAEKASSSSDPLLTDCGEQRAKHLSNYLKDKNITKIYSTDFKRTQATAQPTAQQLELSVKLYNPTRLRSLAKLLKKQKQNILVVGHSNTTGKLAGILSNNSLIEFQNILFYII